MLDAYQPDVRVLLGLLLNRITATEATVLWARLVRVHELELEVLEAVGRREGELEGLLLRARAAVAEASAALDALQAAASLETLAPAWLADQRAAIACSLGYIEQEAAQARRNDGAGRSGA